MNIYFDNAAAVPVTLETLNRFTELSLAFHANQESSGFHGVRESRAVADAERLLLETLNLPKDNSVLWTSSGSEGILCAFVLIEKSFPKGGTILYSDFEHHAVLAALKRLPEHFIKRKIPLTQNGTLDLDELDKMLSSDTILVTAGAIQSETGAINPVSKIGNLIRLKSPHAVFLCDAIQLAGKLPHDLPTTERDMILISGQKFGCPSSGALICGCDFSVQTKNMRKIEHIPGRIAPANAILLAERLSLISRNMTSSLEHIENLKRHLLDTLSGTIEGKFRLTLPPDAAMSPYIVHLTLNSYQGAIVTRALSMDGISVSPGSACASETREVSHVLKAMKLSETDAYSALRISFFTQNTIDETERFADTLKKVLADY